jgi:cytoskeletal protein CcmA (bactofilin family)
MFTRRDQTAQRTPLADIRPIEKLAEQPSPFSKTARAEERPTEASAPPPVKPMFGSASGSPSSGAPHGMASFSAGSIIGNDLTIMGQGLRIVTKGTLQVDGRIEGDVVGQEVIIGEKGQVTGVVSGETVIVRGAVNGTVKGMSVVLQSGARVDGDVHHHQLAVEQGAWLDGRVRRPQDASELKPDLEGGAPPNT